MSYIVGFGTQGLYFLLLARALEVEDFGIWAGALALTSVFSGLVGLGAGNVMVVRASRSRNLLSVQLGSALVYIFMSAIPLGSLAWIIGSATGPVFAHVLLILLASELIAVRLFDIALQVFQAQDDLSRNSLCRIYGGAFRLVAVCLFYLYGTHSVVSWSYWYAWTTTISAVISLGWAFKQYGMPRVQRSSLKNTWKTGIFFAIGISSRTMYLEADKFVLNLFGLSGAAGSLSAANRILTMAFAPIQALVYSSNTAFFRAGELGARHLWPTIKRPLLFTLAYGILAGLIISLLAPAVPVLLGPSYAEASRFLVWLSPIILLNGVHYLFGDALMGLGRQGPRSIGQFVIAAVSILANIILIPIFGVMASVFTALSCSLCLALLMVAMFWTVHRRTPTEIAEKCP